MLIVLVIALVAMQAWHTFVGMSAKAQSWEYAIEAPRDGELPARLRALGLSGWEIVSARRATSEMQGKTVAEYEMILRRPAAVTDGVPSLPPSPR